MARNDNAKRKLRKRLLALRSAVLSPSFGDDFGSAHWSLDDAQRTLGRQLADVEDLGTPTARRLGLLSSQALAWRGSGGGMSGDALLEARNRAGEADSHTRSAWFEMLTTCHNLTSSSARGSIQSYQYRARQAIRILLAATDADAPPYYIPADLSDETNPPESAQPEPKAESMIAPPPPASDDEPHSEPEPETGLKGATLKGLTPRQKRPIIMRAVKEVYLKRRSLDIPDESNHAESRAINAALIKRFGHTYTYNSDTIRTRYLPEVRAKTKGQ